MTAFSAYSSIIVNGDAYTCIWKIVETHIQMFLIDRSSTKKGA